MNKLDIDYQNLIKDILENGVKKEDRTGTGTISVFGRQIRHKMSSGFPLLTTKKMAWKRIVTELRWFLNGYTNIKYLIDNNCHIWDGDCYKNYIKKNKNFIELSQTDFIDKIKNDDDFAKNWGDLGKIYGYQWRNFNGKIDQITNVMNDLIENPNSRRLIVTAWNPSDLSEQVLPPCHNFFQFNTRELTFEERCNIYLNKLDDNNRDIFIKHTTDIIKLKTLNENRIPTRALSLLFYMRSVDIPLGFPFNIASYGLLLLMMADEVNMMPDEVIASLGDTHIYLNQIDGCNEQLLRESYDLSTVYVKDGLYSNMDNDIVLENYKSHPKIYFPLSN